MGLRCAARRVQGASFSTRGRFSVIGGAPARRAHVRTLEKNSLAALGPSALPHSSSSRPGRTIPSGASGTRSAGHQLRKVGGGAYRLNQRAQSSELKQACRVFDPYSVHRGHLRRQRRRGEEGLRPADVSMGQGARVKRRTSVTWVSRWLQWYASVVLVAFSCARQCLRPSWVELGMGIEGRSSMHIGCETIGEAEGSRESDSWSESSTRPSAMDLSLRWQVLGPLGISPPLSWVARRLAREWSQHLTSGGPSGIRARRRT